MQIKGVGSPAGAAPAAGRPSGASTFSVPAGAASVKAQAAVSATGLDTLIGLQEWEGAPARDRRARKHGRAMLDALARLQLGLLANEADGPALAGLAALLDQCPDAADQGLRDALAAVSLRARIELARRGAG